MNKPEEDNWYRFTHLPDPSLNSFIISKIYNQYYLIHQLQYYKRASESYIIDYQQPNNKYHMQKDKDQTANTSNQPSIPQTPKQQLVIYVLELEMDRWYVGKTTKSRLQNRIKQHKTYGKKSAGWVKIFKFKREATQYYKYDNVSPFDEDRVVKQLMHIKGLNKVRGGSYARVIDLTKQQTQFIMRQIQGATDCCFRCGQTGHFITKCPILTNEKKQKQKQQKQKQLKRNNDGTKVNEKKDPYWYVPQCTKCLEYGHYPQKCDFDQFQSSRKQYYLKRVRCYNCGKYGHYANNCNEQSCSDGYYYYDDYSDQSFQSQEIIYTDSRDKYNPDYQCWDCGNRGYTRNNCPRCKGQFNPNHYCWNCGQQGYTVDNCPACNQDDDYNPNHHCWTCNLIGYTKNNCPRCRKTIRNELHQSQYNPRYQCFGCQKKGYTTKNCPNKQCVKKRFAIQKSGASYKNNKTSYGIKCQRCGLPNHTFSNCINQSCIRSRRYRR